jgi:MinD superfamily P-loop ATPase
MTVEHFTLRPPPPATLSSICAACPRDCLEACFNDAIVLLAGGGIAIDPSRCAGCGACTAVCDFDLIQLEDGIARIVPASHFK